MRYTWKITYGNGKDAVTSYFMTVNSMAQALAAMARNAKAFQFNVEKLNDDVRERPAGKGDDSDTPSPDSQSGGSTENKKQGSVKSRKA